MKNYLLIILSLVICLSLLTACGTTKAPVNLNDNNLQQGSNTKLSSSQDNNKIEKQGSVNLEELKKNIIIENFVTPNNKVILHVKNNNNKKVGLNLSVELLDENNNVVESKDFYEIYGLVANGETYIGIPTFKNFAKVNLRTEINNDQTEDSHMEEVSLTSVDNGNNIIVTAKNNSSSDINLTVITVIFYKDNQIIDSQFKNSYETLKKGDSAEMKVYYPIMKGTDKPFDKYEVYLVNALNSKPISTEVDNSVKEKIDSILNNL